MYAGSDYRHVLISRLYVYFDGKKTTDEIIFRTEMSRRHLREVLHEFEEYVRHPQQWSDSDVAHIPDACIHPAYHLPTFLTTASYDLQVAYLFVEPCISATSGLCM